MIALGISEDFFDAGAALAVDGRLVFAANEERYTREKNAGGFPRCTLAAIREQAGIDPAEAELVCVAGIRTPPAVVRLFPWIHDVSRRLKRARKGRFIRRILDGAALLNAARGYRLHVTESEMVRRAPLLTMLTRFRAGEQVGRDARMFFVEHHHAHAAGAAVLSGFDSALCLTADGMGDGLSLTVSLYRAGGMPERLWAIPARDSFGLFFEALTEAFGFVPCRDEGKLTGLAAYGEANRVSEPLPFRMDPEGGIHYDGPSGPRAVAWIQDRLLGRFAREDVAAWAQQALETFITRVARQWLRQTGEDRLCVAGGVFANVKLNQRLHGLPEVSELFVLPNMGDGGLSVGALAACGMISPVSLPHVFLGDHFDEDACRTALERAGLPFMVIHDSIALADRIAALIADGHCVARFDGAMEWGPRALGNRSILAPADRAEVPERLNRCLRRSDFMPFAPVMLEEDAPLWLRNYEAARHAAEFMTVCFDCAPAMRDRFPAVVHVDGTARAQLAREATNPGLSAILKALKKRTGASVALNTSFNMHEEPIVRTPAEAVAAFREAGLDALILGPCLVEGVRK